MDVQRWDFMKEKKNTLSSTLATKEKSKIEEKNKIKKKN